MDKIYQKTHPAGKNAGFTLIELLVVVLIIGILAAVALPQYEKAVEKSRMSEGITMATAIGRAGQVYYMANGTYPTDIGDLDLDFPGEKVLYKGVNSVQTKNFVCRSAGVAEEGGWSDVLAVCNRLPKSTIYAIAYLKTGEMVCRWYSAKGETFCKTSGLRSQSN